MSTVTSTAYTSTAYYPTPLPVSQNYEKPKKDKQNKTSLGTKLMGAVNNAAAKAQRSWDMQTDSRFRKHFNFPFTELLYGEFWAQVWSAGQPLSCSIYLSSNYVSISAKVKDANKNKVPIQILIPYNTISKVQRATTAAANSGGMPTFQPVYDPRMAADAIQIFTTTGTAHQLNGFFHIDKFWQMLECLWRQAAPMNWQNAQASAPGQQYTPQPNTAYAGAPFGQQYAPFSSVPQSAQQYGSQPGSQPGQYGVQPSGQFAGTYPTPASTVTTTTYTDTGLQKTFYPTPSTTVPYQQSQ